MSIIRFNNGSGYFSGDISANDVSFNNVDIEENLKVRNNLEVIGDISANDASFFVSDTLPVREREREWREEEEECSLLTRI